MRKKSTCKLAVYAGATAFMALAPHSQAQSSADLLINKLEQKGILSVDEARELRAEEAQSETNLENQFVSSSKWKLSGNFKNMELYGDVRLRYEYRAVNNNPDVNVPGFGNNDRGTFARERYRYALRFGVRGDAYENFYYGIRLETSTNPRSPWDTFGNNTTANSATPSDKAQSGIGVGQIYIGWRPTDWFEMTLGRMPMPLYTTPMVWDSDINPEGAFEKLKYTTGPFDWFADFGQWDYQDPTSASDFPSTDTFLLTSQVGATAHMGKDVFAKVGPMLYVYANVPPPATYSPFTGNPNYDVLGMPFTGQGDINGANAGLSSNVSGTNPLGPYNEYGLDDLLVLEIPAELDFKIWKSPLGTLQGRLFGDFAINLEGAERARAAEAATAGTTAPTLLTQAYTGDVKAYQIGIGIGSPDVVYGPTQGLVYGTSSKKNTWEARFYWQHIEQYALDPNMIDSDFFEGRGNLEGYYMAFAYCFADGIIGTVRYGHADRINPNLGTGGSNLDIPWYNPIQNYNVAQVDLTMRF